MDAQCTLLSSLWRGPTAEPIDLDTTQLSLLYFAGYSLLPCAARG